MRSVWRHISLLTAARRYLTKCQYVKGCSGRKQHCGDIFNEENPVHCCLRLRCCCSTSVTVLVHSPTGYQFSELTPVKLGLL
ncbi:hypothetical protein F2P81_014216 [Scophthalmus maximus]|uniref:Uncharacterized protein n=1 Tax=Scophthalmus maximus TaxID=52904 RepID=A0A6A4SQH6_SCOMX|nr:hypothetical protein F2P81_014216 [Scophthalmus maximus]